MIGRSSASSDHGHIDRRHLGIMRHFWGRGSMPAQPFSRRHVWRLAAALLTAGSFTAGRASAQSPRAVRYRATIDAADAKSISLTTRSGQQLTMAVASDTVILAIVPFKLEDIKPGSYIGSAAVPPRDWNF